jgi:hypothetical protein
MPTIWSPEHHCPLTFSEAGSSCISLCNWCGERKSARNSFGFTLTSKHINTHFLENRFCRDCFEVYRIYRPSDEELQLRIHQRYTRTADVAVSEVLPVCLKDIVNGFVGKYPSV